MDCDGRIFSPVGLSQFKNWCDCSSTRRPSKSTSSQAILQDSPCTRLRWSDYVHKELRHGRDLNKILLDANLLVLLVIGLTNRDLVLKHKRTKTFEQVDFDLLVKILSNYDAIVVTPHILTEVSNLISQIGEPALSRVRSTFSTLVEEQQEVFCASKDSVKHPAFIRLGLTDASILQLMNSTTPLLTTDLGLYLEAAKSNPLAENFNHLRQAGLLSS